MAMKKEREGNLELMRDGDDRNEDNADGHLKCDVILKGCMLNCT